MAFTFQNMINAALKNNLELQHKENVKQKIFFEGQIYDAYSLIIDIIKKANKKILIIDNYIDDSVLKMLTKKNKNVEVVLLTSDKSNIQKIDIQKFNKEFTAIYFRTYINRIKNYISICKEGIN